jgi:hypothetical protein
VILDPNDPTVGFIGSATDGIGGAVGDALLVKIHPPRSCEGRACVIHNPSDHEMRGWPLHWRQDRSLMERTCPHGVGHPDPDDVAYKESRGSDYAGVHGCDGCCRSLPE